MMKIINKILVFSKDRCRFYLKYRTEEYTEDVTSCISATIRDTATRMNITKRNNICDSGNRQKLQDKITKKLTRNLKNYFGLELNKLEILEITSGEIK